ncbi:hypothetical protein HPB51_005459 [Rhipicephalus microplus]|uniref:Uncharacterized protein n=1 Tax=Rhipicephalus microplus TaxID=6941 RepID=A0A9J6EYE8_RHIMP|nr:hypothetical protein HPB51_005459 [Rhipicephalus microplus]
MSVEASKPSTLIYQQRIVCVSLWQAQTADITASWQPPSLRGTSVRAHKAALGGQLLEAPSIRLQSSASSKQHRPLILDRLGGSGDGKGASCRRRRRLVRPWLTSAVFFSSLAGETRQTGRSMASEMASDPVGRPGAVRRRVHESKRARAKAPSPTSTRCASSARRYARRNRKTSSASRTYSPISRHFRVPTQLRKFLLSV